MMMHRPAAHCALGIDPQRQGLALSGARFPARVERRGLPVPHAMPPRKKDYLSFDWEGDDLSITDDAKTNYDAKNRYDDFIRSDSPAYTSTHRSRRSGGLSPAWNRFDNTEYYDDEFEDDIGYDDSPPVPVTLSDEKRYLNGKPIATNYEITQPLLRLIGDQKEPIGMKTRDVALEMALEARMDLILINPQEAPPVARLMEWSKFKFEIEQGEKTKKAKAVVVETKEIRISPKTDDNDISTKIKSTQKFLSKGNKVKLVMKFEGRQLQHKDHGKEVLMRFITDLGESAKVEGPLSFKGAMYQVILIPGKMAPGSPAPPSPSTSSPSRPEGAVREESGPADAASTAPAPVAPPSPASAPGLPLQMPIRPPSPVAPPVLNRPLSPVPPGGRPVGSPGPPPLRPAAPPPRGAPMPPGPPLPPIRPPSLPPLSRPPNTLQTASREQYY